VVFVIIRYMKNILAILFAVVIGLAVVYFAREHFSFNFQATNEPVYNQTGSFNRNDITFNYEDIPEGEEVVIDQNSGIAPEVTVELMPVNIPLFGETGVVFEKYVVPESPAVLNATYTKLFELEANPTESEFISNSAVVNSGLSFDSVTLSGGVVRLNLRGQYQGMHMGDSIFRKQINAAAFQYSTVNSIEVYVNNERFDWCIGSDADVSESGCDTTPRYWIDAK